MLRAVGPHASPLTRRPWRATAARPAAALSAPPGDLSCLLGCAVVSADSGAVLPAASLASEGETTVLAFLTHAGDFDSHELAAALADALPALAAGGVRLAMVLPSSPAAVATFARITRLPLSLLYSDESAACYKALGFSEGAGSADNFPHLKNVGGMGRLLAMCAGVGSPGTLAEVARGYLGDRGAPPVFREGTAADRPQLRRAFAVLGDGYQRPFELATLRGLNMAAVLGEWGALAPADDSLLVQRGGVLVVGRGGEVAWRHDDRGILGYARAGDVLRAAGVGAAAGAGGAAPAGGRGDPAATTPSG